MSLWIILWEGNLPQTKKHKAWMEDEDWMAPMVASGNILDDIRRLILMPGERQILYLKITFWQNNTDCGYLCRDTRQTNVSGCCSTRPIPSPVCLYQNIIMTPTQWHYCYPGAPFYPNTVSLSIINNKQNGEKKRRHRKAKPYLHWKWWIIESGRHKHRCRRRHAHTHMHAHSRGSPLGLHCHLELVCRNVHKKKSRIRGIVWGGLQLWWFPERCKVNSMMLQQFITPKKIQ